MPLQIVEEIHIDVSTSDLTIAQVLREVDRIRAEHPDREVFLDGDSRSIMSRGFVTKVKDYAHMEGRV